MTPGWTTPERFENAAALDEFLSRPTPEVVTAMGELDGDIMVLGVGGKMGPSLAALARRASDAAGVRRRVIGVSRFSSKKAMAALNAAGVETIACDLLDDAALRALPDAPNIVYMAGMKFGATGREGQTWALNAFLPGLVARRFAGARFVVFSSGNVYPFVPVSAGGCSEETPPSPVGEYAQSVLGRERVFTYVAGETKTPGVILRLNYAVEMRYGVLLDVASAVWSGEPIDVRTGYANVIWQGDANAVALRALAHVQSPPLILNITGPEIVSIRDLAQQFGKLMGKPPVFAGAEQADALLNGAARAHMLFGRPRVPLGQMIAWTADWVRRGGETLHKPTKFHTRFYLVLPTLAVCCSAQRRC
jgi:nucleoside-diphosphate-sugar epimerase